MNTSKRNLIIFVTIIVVLGVVATFFIRERFLQKRQEKQQQETLQQLKDSISKIKVQDPVKVENDLKILQSKAKLDQPKVSDQELLDSLRKTMSNKK